MATRLQDAVAPAAPELLDALARVLRARLGGSVELGALEPFGDGHSGFTYALDVRHDGREQRCVLRLSPPGVRIAGPADVGRQGRIMAALGAAGLPAPRVIACESAPALAGRAFALLELVEGEPWQAAFARGGARAVAGAAVALLVRLRGLTRAQTGIGGDRVVTPAGEVERWSALIARTPLAAQAAPLARALLTAAPVPSARPSLVHGDFHYGNLLFRDGAIVALLDWEIATLGEPLADLGCLGVAALRQRYAPDPNPIGFDLPLDELIALAGAEPDAATWFVAASCLKYAAILAYNRELHRKGRRIDPLYESLERTMHGLLDDGARLLAGGLDALAPASAAVPRQGGTR